MIIYNLIHLINLIWSPIFVKIICINSLSTEIRSPFKLCKTFFNFKTLEKPKKNTTNISKQAESAVANYLESQGHTTIERNHKTKFYEINLVSTIDNHIYFTEVNFHSNPNYGSGFDAITPTKLKQMISPLKATSNIITPNLNLLAHSSLPPPSPAT